MRKFTSILKNSPWFAVTSITALALLLRLSYLRTEPLWGDEILSLDIVLHFGKSIPTMLRYLSEVEFHPPLYYIVMHFWIELFGSGNGAIRALSVIFGTASIPLVYVWTKRMFLHNGLALTAAFIVAVLPIQIEYGQEARPYALVGFFGVLAAYSLWCYLENRKGVWMAVYISACIIGLYLHYSFIFIQLALVSAWLTLELLKGIDFRKFTAWLGINSIVALGFSFWLPALLYKIVLGRFEIINQRMTNLNRTPIFFYEAYDQLIWLLKDDVLPNYIILLKSVFLIGVIFAVLKSWRFEPGDWKGVKIQRLVYLFILTVVPVLVFLMSPQSNDYTTILYRHVLFVSFPLAILLALVFTSLGKRNSIVAIVVFLATLVPFSSAILDNDVKTDYDFNLQSAGKFINDNYMPGDLVLVNASPLRTDFNHFLREDVQAYGILPYDYYGNDEWSSRSTLGMVENETQVRMDFVVNETKLKAKLDYYFGKYHPKRVWMFPVSTGDRAIMKVMSEEGWEIKINPIGKTFPLVMFRKDADVQR